MNNVFSRVNFKVLNLAAWITLVSAYVFPLSAGDGAIRYSGFPFAFLKVYDSIGGKNLLGSFHISAGALIMDVFAIYALILCALKISDKIKGIKDKR